MDELVTACIDYSRILELLLWKTMEAESGNYRWRSPVDWAALDVPSRIDRPVSAPARWAASAMPTSTLPTARARATGRAAIMVAVIEHGIGGEVSVWKLWELFSSIWMSTSAYGILHTFCGVWGSMTSDFRQSLIRTLHKKLASKQGDVLIANIINYLS